jgi:hypothetical protein
MAKFELHKTFSHPQDSELMASADRLSDVIRAWEDDLDSGFDCAVLNTDIDAIVWRPSVAVFPDRPLTIAGHRH